MDAYSRSPESSESSTEDEDEEVVFNRQCQKNTLTLICREKKILQQLSRRKKLYQTTAKRSLGPSSKIVLEDFGNIRHHFFSVIQCGTWQQTNKVKKATNGKFTEEKKSNLDRHLPELQFVYNTVRQSSLITQLRVTCQPTLPPAVNFNPLCFQDSHLTSPR